MWVAARPCVAGGPACAWRLAGRPCRPLLTPVPGAPHHPSGGGCQEAGSAARLLADLTFTASGCLPALEVLLQLGVGVFRGEGRGPVDPGLSGRRLEGAALQSSASSAPLPAHAPPNGLVPRSFAFISMKPLFLP